jgi:alpha-L-rhamnosidase
MNSFNHYAYGAVGNWLYTSVAGINIDEKLPGYKHIVIKPFLTRDLQYAKAWHHSVYGEVLSHWENRDQKVTLHIKVPANTSAKVIIPCADPGKIHEGIQPLETNEDILNIVPDDNQTTVAVGSGEYHFIFPIPSN